VGSTAVDPFVGVAGSVPQRKEWADTGLSSKGGNVWDGGPTRAGREGFGVRPKHAFIRVPPNRRKGR
jgi:hypothetical protein